jgi:predicted ATPase
MRIAAKMDDFAYELVLGLPVPGDTAFNMDPEVKQERVLLDGAVIVDRKGQSVRLRDADGRPVTHAFDLWSSESVLARLSEPQRYPALSSLRDRFLAWRFYHSFRTDPESPIRPHRFRLGRRRWCRTGETSRPPSRPFTKSAMGRASERPSNVRSPARGSSWAVVM